MTTMDLLDRYLQAVGQYLPEATRQDTLAELRANLLEQMDARAEEVGRPLNSGDMVAMLKEHGKPEAVAVRYLPQRSLIGPTIYPFYVFTLKRVMTLLLAIYVIAQVVTLVSQGKTPGMVMVINLVESELLLWAAVTIIFAMLEYLRSRGKLTDRWTVWDPMQLPAVRGGSKQTKPRSMGRRWLDVLLHCVWLAYWIALPIHPVWRIDSDGTWPGSGTRLGFGMSDTTHAFYVFFVVLLSVELVVKLAGLAAKNDAWQKPTEYGLQVIATVGLAWWVSTKTYFVATSVNVDWRTLTEINADMGIALRVLLAIAVLGVVLKGMKMLRGRMRPARQVAF